MKIFTLNKNVSIVCNHEKTRSGFRHTAAIMDNGAVRYKTKECYLNRTWESYEFQTVLHKAINGYFDKKTAARFIKKVDKQARGEEKKRFDPVKMACAVGDLLCQTADEKANWKKRMLGTVPGIEFPEDFDQLPAEERERRLTAATEVL